MGYIKAIPTTLDSFEQMQNDINQWALSHVPNYTGLRWAEAPILHEGNYYIDIDIRVLDCPICANFVELEIIPIEE